MVIRDGYLPSTRRSVSGDGRNGGGTRIRGDGVAEDESKLLSFGAGEGETTHNKVDCNTS